MEQRRLRGEVMMHLGLAFLWSARFDQASDHFVEAARQSEAAGDLYTALLSHANHGTLYFMLGHLRRAATKFRQTLELAGRHGAPQMPVTAVAYQPLAELQYEWNELAAAEETAEQAVERSLAGGNPRILLLCYVIQARIQAAVAKIEPARVTIAQARRLVEERSLPQRYANDVNTLEIKFWLEQGEVERAAQWVAGSGLRANDPDLSGKEGQYRLLARVLLAQGELHSALDLLRRLYSSAQQTGKVLSLMETLALTSIVELSMGRTGAAMATLQEALAMAAAEGYVRTFLDEGAQMGKLLLLLGRELRQEGGEAARLGAYASRLAAAWHTGVEAEKDPTKAADPKTVSEAVRDSMRDLMKEVAGDSPPLEKRTTMAAALVEPLSERELEVLRLVAEGMSDRQIADHLVIVPGTVKRHLNSVYGKLGVHSRTQAIGRARQLALIENAHGHAHADA
jgi:LuxR family maltose regulon positive regulatory protein